MQALPQTMAARHQKQLQQAALLRQGANKESNVVDLDSLPTGEPTEEELDAMGSWADGQDTPPGVLSPDEQNTPSGAAENSTQNPENTVQAT